MENKEIEPSVYSAKAKKLIPCPHACQPTFVYGHQDDKRVVVSALNDIARKEMIRGILANPSITKRNAFTSRSRKIVVECKRISRDGNRGRLASFSVDKQNKS